MPEKKILVRIATMSNASPTEPNRLYISDLVELTHGVSSIYFLQRNPNFTKYDGLNSEKLGNLYERMTRAGARAMHLTPEESEEVFKIVSERDTDRISKLLVELNKRVKQAGLKGDETKRDEDRGRRGKLFGS